MGFNPTTLLIVCMLLFSFESFTQETVIKSSEKTIVPEDFKELLGDWTGTLTYIDYSSGKPYTMPANLTVEKGKNEYELVLFNNYPNEPKANDKDKLVLSKDGKQLNKKDVKSKEDLADGRVQITIEYRGKDNKKKALIRSVYVLGESQFSIRKEVQFENSKLWKKRNEFKYKR